MLNNFLRTNVNKLNTITKYPSIQTYHTLCKRGMITEDFSIIPEGIKILK